MNPGVIIQKLTITLECVLSALLLLKTVSVYATIKIRNFRIKRHKLNAEPLSLHVAFYFYLLFCLLYLAATTLNLEMYLHRGKFIETVLGYLRSLIYVGILGSLQMYIHQFGCQSNILPGESISEVYKTRKWLNVVNIFMMIVVFVIQLILLCLYPYFITETQTGVEVVLLLPLSMTWIVILLNVIFHRSCRTGRFARWCIFGFCCMIIPFLSFYINTYKDFFQYVTTGLGGYILMQKGFTMIRVLQMLLVVCTLLDRNERRSLYV